MGPTNTGHVMTLANSIIGVSVLAMPFCFKQCGILLAALMLVLSSVLSRLACHYLLKSAIIARRRNFEFLAFQAFGPTGKLIVELSIIGFMLGTCVAFFVVVGDLGPIILAPAIGVESPSILRPTVLIGIGLFVVLPLGLLRNVDSLNLLSAATIAFYLCLVFKVMWEATTHLIAWDWLDKVDYWRPAGILQCIPIFAMALSCQTQLFEIFASMPNASLDKMNYVTRSAINMCTTVYLSVGLFGYIAYSSQKMTGNVMMNFSPSFTSDVIKLGFVLSVAVSFPLVIFPCRASIYSLLFRRGHTPHFELVGGGGANHIPEARFQCITLAIVAISLVTGILIPNIELVLGLVGSTIGVIVCIITPSLIFISLSNKINNERLLAQVLVGTGLLIMVLGTYANLFATEEAMSGPKPLLPVGGGEKMVPTRAPLLPAPHRVTPLGPILVSKPEPNVKIKEETLKEMKDVKELAALPEIKKDSAIVRPLEPSEKKDHHEKKEVKVESEVNARQEPPVPIAPAVENTPAFVVEPAASVLKKPVLEDEKKKEVSIEKGAIKREELKELQALEASVEDKKGKDLMESFIEHEKEEKKLLVEQNKLLEQIKEQNKAIQNDHNEHALEVLKMVEKGNKELLESHKLMDMKLGIAENGSASSPLKEVKLVDKKFGIKGLVDSTEEKSAIVHENEIVLKNDSLKYAEDKVNVPLVENNQPLEKIGRNYEKVLDAPKVVGNEAAVEKKYIKNSVGKELTSRMTNKMARGVPLPLAIQNSARLDEGNIAENNDRIGGSQGVEHALGRNILVKDNREKRDIEEVDDNRKAQRYERVGSDAQNEEQKAVDTQKVEEYRKPLVELSARTETVPSPRYDSDRSPKADDVSSIDLRNIDTELLFIEKQKKLAPSIVVQSELVEANNDEPANEGENLDKVRGTGQDLNHVQTDHLKSPAVNSDTNAGEAVVPSLSTNEKCDVPGDKPKENFEDVLVLANSSIMENSREEIGGPQSHTDSKKTLKNAAEPMQASKLNAIAMEKAAIPLIVTPKHLSDMEPILKTKVNVENSKIDMLAKESAMPKSRDLKSLSGEVNNESAFDNPDGKSL